MVVQNAPPLLWAKSQANHEPSFHPLPCHLRDVAAVASVLWDTALTSAARTGIANALGCDLVTARWWLVWLTGAHDVGKAGPAFQYQPNSAGDVPTAALRAALAAAGLPDDKDAHFPKTPKHGVVSTVILRGVLPDLGWPKAAANRVADAIGGHHGVIPTSAVWNSEGARKARGERCGRWKEVQRTLLDDLAASLGGYPNTAPTRCTVAGAMAIAGLVSVADWLGSDETVFTYAAADTDPADYFALAHGCAARTVADLHWNVPTLAPDAVPRTFAAMFPTISQLNSTQQAAIDHAARHPAPGLAIIEAPMGEGKTEAALYLAEHAATQGNVGAFVALPTQATSNQMFHRVRQYLEGRFPDAAEAVNLQLLHGHAALSAEFALLRAAAHGQERVETDMTPDGVGEDEDGGPQNVIAAAWFTHRKRGLLAPFGVGTVDQALLAVLQTKHVFVRLFGLAHKVVIIDEIHAYDTYMTTLIERLLEWLAALGCPVILLSATLPKERRAALLAAYACGIGEELTEDVTPAAYPRLSWVAGSETGAVSISGVSERSRKNVALQWVDGAVPTDAAAPFPLGELLQRELQDGGCAAVICNTVARAQAVYAALQHHFPRHELATDANGATLDGHPALDLFHARYRFAERQAREERALLRFGKPDGTVEAERDGDPVSLPVRRPHRAILVATQVIEQSLDLDFDLMISDIAPADLVLQRAGRLHRHNRGDDRPANLRKPVLHLCLPDNIAEGAAATAEEVPLFGKHFDLVYDAHVLLRSWLALREKTTLKVPEEVEHIIEAVYDDREPPNGMYDALRAEWETTRAASQRDYEKEKSEAEQRFLKRPTADVDMGRMFDGTLEEDDAPDFHERFRALTRLGEDSVSAVLLFPDEQHLLPKGQPTVAQARELLRRAANISTRRAVVHIREHGEQPAAWRKVALLRNVYLVRLQEDGTHGEGASRLWYDRDDTGLQMVSATEGAI